MLAAALIWIKANPKAILYAVIAILIAAICWKLWDAGWRACKADENEKKIVALEDALAAEREYLNRVLQGQQKNQSFVTRQRKALADAKEADAPAADVLVNTIVRLHNDPRAAE